MVSVDKWKNFFDASQRAFGCFTREKENKIFSPSNCEGVKRKNIWRKGESFKLNNYCSKVFLLLADKRNWYLNVEIAYAPEGEAEARSSVCCCYIM